MRGERRPLVISASGSLDLEDIHGVGRPNWFQKGPAKAAVAQIVQVKLWNARLVRGLERVVPHLLLIQNIKNDFLDQYCDTLTLEGYNIDALL